MNEGEAQNQKAFAPPLDGAKIENGCPMVAWAPHRPWKFVSVYLFIIGVIVL